MGRSFASRCFPCLSRPAVEGEWEADGLKAQPVIVQPGPHSSPCPLADSTAPPATSSQPQTLHGNSNGPNSAATLPADCKPSTSSHLVPLSEEAFMSQVSCPFDPELQGALASLSAAAKQHQGMDVLINGSKASNCVVPAAGADSPADEVHLSSSSEQVVARITPKGGQICSKEVMASEHGAAQPSGRLATMPSCNGQLCTALHEDLSEATASFRRFASLPDHQLPIFCRACGGMQLRPHPLLPADGGVDAQRGSFSERHQHQHQHQQPAACCCAGGPQSAHGAAYSRSATDHALGSWHRHSRFLYPQIQPYLSPQGLEVLMDSFGLAYPRARASAANAARAPSEVSTPQKAAIGPSFPELVGLPQLLFASPNRHQLSQQQKQQQRSNAAATASPNPKTDPNATGSPVSRFGRQSQQKNGGLLLQQRHSLDSNRQHHMQQQQQREAVLGRDSSDAVGDGVARDSLMHSLACMDAPRTSKVMSTSDQHSAVRPNLFNDDGSLPLAHVRQHNPLTTWNAHQGPSRLDTIPSSWSQEHSSTSATTLELLDQLTGARRSSSLQTPGAIARNSVERVTNSRLSSSRLSDMRLSDLRLPDSRSFGDVAPRLSPGPDVALLEVLDSAVDEVCKGGRGGADVGAARDEVAEQPKKQQVLQQEAEQVLVRPAIQTASAAAAGTEQQQQQQQAAIAEAAAPQAQPPSATASIGAATPAPASGSCLQICPRPVDCGIYTSHVNAKRMQLQALSASSSASHVRAGEPFCTSAREHPASEHPISASPHDSPTSAAARFGARMASVAAAGGLPNSPQAAAGKGGLARTCSNASGIFEGCNYPASSCSSPVATLSAGCAGWVNGGSLEGQSKIQVVRLCDTKIDALRQKLRGFAAEQEREWQRRQQAIAAQQQQQQQALAMTLQEQQQKLAATLQQQQQVLTQLQAQQHALVAEVAEPQALPRFRKPPAVPPLSVLAPSMPPPVPAGPSSISSRRKSSLCAYPQERAVAAYVAQLQLQRAGSMSANSRNIQVPSPSRRRASAMVSPTGGPPGSNHLPPSARALGCAAAAAAAGHWSTGSSGGHPVSYTAFPIGGSSNSLLHTERVVWDNSEAEEAEEQRSQKEATLQFLRQLSSSNTSFSKRPSTPRANGCSAGLPAPIKVNSAGHRSILGDDPAPTQPHHNPNLLSTFSTFGQPGFAAPQERVI